MILLTIIFLVIDIVSKILVSNLFDEHVSVEIIDKFFSITYVKNTGAAFSILNNNTNLVLVISGIIILGIFFYIYRNKTETKFENIVYAMILGGALGNFIDRIIYGYVIDFIDFTIFGYNYPIFNIADIFIVCGVILLMIYTWRCSDE